MIECRTISGWTHIGGKEYHPNIAVDFPKLPFEAEDIENSSHHDPISVLIYPDDEEMLEQIRKKGYDVTVLEVI